MKKMIDLIAPPKSNKDEKLLNYIRRTTIKTNRITNVCFIYGQGSSGDVHEQISSKELKELVSKQSKDTIYFLCSFFFDLDRENYLKVIEYMCINNIQIYKTDQKIEHVTNDKEWLNKYCKFITLEDIEVNNGNI